MHTIDQTLNQINIIRKLEHDFYAQHGVRLFDISHWNPGEDYLSGMRKTFEIEFPEDYYNYMYNYTLDLNTKVRIKRKLNINDNYCCNIFNSATAAIVALSNVLTELNIKKICVLQPSYFSAPICFRKMNINIEYVSYYFNESYHIPITQILDNDYDAVWLTQPVLSTGLFLQSKEINILAESGILVLLDECMCNLSDIVILQKGFTHNYKNVFQIISPHKAISINSVKFCCLICSPEYYKIVNYSADVFTGGLLISTNAAIQHFLSDNFEICLKFHEQFTKSNKLACDNWNEEYGGIYKSSDASKGTYEIYRVPSIPFSTKINYDFMYKIMRQSFVTFIPGCINNFNEEHGFCFRINHTLNINDLIGALGRLAKLF